MPAVYGHDHDDDLLPGELPDMRLNIMPLNDLREHTPGGGCWCNPVLDDECDMWVHKPLDRRDVFYPESLEQGFFLN